MSRVISFEGRRISVPDDATDDEIAIILGGGEQKPAAPTMSVGEDVARSAATGAREGGESLVGQFGDAANFQGNVAGWLAGKVGASPETQESVRKWGSRLHPFAMLPSTDQLRAGVTDPAVKAAGAEDVLAHEPQTVAGDYARTTAQFLPAAASPGGAVRKTASVAVPAVLSETAGQLTEGSGWEPYARFLGALVGGAATVPKAPKGAPRATVPELEAAGNAAYKASEDAGVVINKVGMRTLAKNIIDDLTEHGFDPANEPGAVPALKRIAQNADGNVTLKGLDTIRKVASNGYIAGNKSNNAAISKIINRIDELMTSEDPALMAGLDTEAGVRSLKDARKYWHQARKLETAEKFGAKGEAIGNSQINQDIEGATRRQVRTLLTNESKARGFSKEELAAAKKAASMTPGMRAVRTVSGLFPQGRLGGMLHGGAGFAGIASLLAGNPVPLMLQGTGMVVGYGAKNAEEALSKRAYQEFVDLIANGKPTVKASIPKRLSKPEEIARLLMLGHQSRAGAAMRSPVEELNR